LAQLSMGGSQRWRVVGSPACQPGTCWDEDNGRQAGIMHNASTCTTTCRFPLQPHESFLTPFMISASSAARLRWWSMYLR
jgi:hypothetical protein